MSEEAHLVNGERDYIRLLEGIVDHYLCWECGATVEDDLYNENERSDHH